MKTFLTLTISILTFMTVLVYLSVNAHKNDVEVYKPNFNELKESGLVQKGASATYFISKDEYNKNPNKYQLVKK